MRRLIAERVGVRFADRVVLHDVSLCVELGLAVALVGPSGTGKTTLLNVLGGLLKADRGSVRVEGDGPPRAPRPGSDVGWVHQGANLLGERTVLDNVALGALARGNGRGDVEPRVVEALRAVGVQDRSSDRANTLSGGERQRVVLARALAAGTSFVLADEPTGSLDADNSSRVAHLLVAVVAHGSPTGVVIATHDRAVAARCDVVVDLVSSSPVPS